MGRSSSAEEETPEGEAHTGDNAVGAEGGEKKGDSEMWPIRHNVCALSSHARLYNDKRGSIVVMELEEDFFPNMREMETCWCYITEGRENKTQCLFLHLPVGLPFFLSLFFFVALPCNFCSSHKEEKLPSNISSLCFSSHQLIKPT